MTPGRARLLIAGALVAAACVLLLGASPDTTDDPAFDGDRSGYEADAPRTADRSGEPTLVGDAAPVDPDAPQDVVIAVRNNGGYPVAGVPVTLLPTKLKEEEASDAWKFAKRTSAPSVFTDAHGLVRFSDVPIDGSRRAVVFRAHAHPWPPVSESGLWMHSVAVETQIVASSTSLRLGAARRVDVQLVHALTGEHLQGDVTSRSVLVSSASRVARPMSLDPGFLLGLLLIRDHESGFSTDVPNLHFWQALPPGLARAEPHVAFRTRRISPLASRVLFVNPAWPEAELRIAVPRMASDPHRYQTLDKLRYLPDLPWRVSKPTLTGHSRVHGVPFAPRAQLEYVASLPQGGECVGHIRFGRDPRHEVLTEIRLPDLSPREALSKAFEDVFSPVGLEDAPPAGELPPLDPPLPVGVDGDDPWGDRGDVEDTSPLEAVPPKEVAKPKTWKIRLRILRPDGTPATGASVLAAHPAGTNYGVWTDADRSGRVTLEGPWPARIGVNVVGAGAHMEREIARTDQEVTLRATSGGRVEVRVVDEEGKGLPFARVDVGRLAPDVRLVDGVYVQRIDPYVDHRGRRAFHMVQPGEHEISATYFHAEGKAKVTVVEGKTVKVTVRIDLGTEDR